MWNNDATQALHKYVLAAGVYAEMSNEELVQELLKLWALLPAKHPLCALISEVISRLGNDQ